MKMGGEYTTGSHDRRASLEAALAVLLERVAAHHDLAPVLEAEAVQPESTGQLGVFRGVST